jgi:hypothetical protein
MPKPNLTAKYDPKCLLAAKKLREKEQTLKKLRYAFNGYYYGGLKLWWNLRKQEVKSDHYESGAYRDYQVCKGKNDINGDWIPATYDEERRFQEIWLPEWEDFIKMYWESFGNGIIPIPEVNIELQEEIIHRNQKSEIDLILERTQEILEFFAEEFTDLLIQKQSKIEPIEQVKLALQEFNRIEKEDVSEAIEERVSLEHAETLLSKQYGLRPEADLEPEMAESSPKSKSRRRSSVEVVAVLKNQSQELAIATKAPTTIQVRSRNKKQSLADAQTWAKANGYEFDGGEVEGVQVISKTKKPLVGVSELNILDISSSEIPF